MFPLFVPLFHFVRNQSSLARTYSVLARKLEHAARTESILIPTKQLTSRSFPFTLIDQELTHICLQLISRLGSAHPGLANIAQNYFLDPRNQLRSSATLLFAKATNGLGEGWQEKQRLAAYQASSGLDEELDRPLHHPGLLYGSNPCMADDPSSFADVFRLRRPGVDPLMRPLPPSLESSISSDVGMPPSILPTQLRLAQIVEMIYLASLLCDHVTDTSPESAIDNKLAVLGSDFLLGRAGTALSSLGECEVVELVVTIISNQVEGEINRMQSSKLGCVQEQGPSSLDEGWDLYLKTIYLRIASLMGKSVRGAVILGGSRETELYKDVAYAYGRNLGMAHQLVEDACAFEEGLSDLKSGLATAPALFACEEYPEMQTYVSRNFSLEGDLEAAFDCVSRSSAIERTRDLARSYAQKACDVLRFLPENNAESGLEALASWVVN